MLQYQMTARRLDAHGAQAATKEARILLDTDPAGRRDAFNPAELLLAAVAACMMKNIERVAPMIKFDFRDAMISLVAERQDKPPRIASISYELVVDTDEEDRRLELLHQNLRKFGTISNTVAAATKFDGTIRRGKCA